MVANDTGPWESLERRSATAFLAAGVIFAVDAALVGSVIAGAGDQLMLLGQALIAAGWTAGFVGLLGLFPGLADRSRRLARAGAVLVGIGVVVFVGMGIASLAYFTGVLSGDFSALVPVFLPGVIIGSVLGFLTFGAATLRTDLHSRSVGALVVMLGLVPVVNILSGVAGIQSLTATLVIVAGLSLGNLALGYLLRSAGVSNEHTGVESPREPAA